MTVLKIETTSPKDELIKKLGNLDEIEISGAQVLVATYVRPEKTKGGIILTDNARKEDEYQGKVGLVVKLGPLAFSENDQIKFNGFNVSIGDWVFYRAQDSYAMGINGNHCRLLDDIHIRGKVDSPDVIY